MYGTKLCVKPDAELTFFPVPFRMDKTGKEKFITFLTENKESDDVKAMASAADAVYIAWPRDIVSYGKIVGYEISTLRADTYFIDSNQSAIIAAVFRLTTMGRSFSFERIKPALLIFVFEEDQKIRTLTQEITLQHHNAERDCSRLLLR